jgi:hypothetical protein
MDYGAIVDRLRANCPSFKVVDFAATFEVLKARGLPALPAAFVLPGKETASPQQERRRDAQRGDVSLSRVQLVKFAGDAFGGDAQTS